MSYPPIEPHKSGYLDVGDGNELYWEECGNPNGKPALFLDGGPGSGCTPGQRRNFDPSKYRIILFDQRNCGRSKPHASEAAVDLSRNTTDHLIADIEALRQKIGLERWLVFGVSWGAVLAVAYGEQHPKRVSELILMVMGTGRRMETDLMTTGFGRLFPDAWRRFEDFSKRSTVEGTVIDRYHDLLFHADHTVNFDAAKHWCEWEAAIVPTSTPSARFESPDFRLAFARIVTHYWRNGSWMEEGQLLGNAHKLLGIPGAILQGRLDLTNLSGSPWELAAQWRDCSLEFFDSGHEGNSAMLDRLISITDALSGQ